MAEFRIVPQTAQTSGKVNMDVIGRELSDLQWEVEKVRNALRFRIRNREQIGENLRRIGRDLTAQQEFAMALRDCLAETAGYYQAAETQVLAQYGVEKNSVLGDICEAFRDQPDWLKALELSYLPMLITTLGPTVIPTLISNGSVAWAGYLRTELFRNPEGMPETFSLFGGDSDGFTANILGVPVSFRKEWDVLGYERNPGDGYTLEEVKSYLFKRTYELDIGDWHREGAISLGNTDTYYDCSFDDLGTGLMGLLLQSSCLPGGAVPQEGMLQGSLVNFHFEGRNGTETENKHFSHDFYVGEAHAQYGSGFDLFGEKRIVGVDCDYGASIFKYVGAKGQTWENGRTLDFIGGLDAITIGDAHKLIRTNQRTEGGFGFSEGHLGGYLGFKYYGY